MNIATVQAAQIASAMREFETAAPVEGPGPRLGARIAASRFAKALARPVLSPEIKEYLLPDVVADGRTGLIFSQGRVIEETRARAAGRLRPVDDAIVVRDSGDLLPVMGFSGLAYNYFHWMTECLPAIYAAVEINQSASAIVLRWQSGFQRESLELLGLDRLPILELPSDAQVRFERLIYSTYQTGAARICPSHRAQEMYRRLAAPYADLPRTREFYIWRGGMKGVRPIVNEEALAARLAAMGLEIVTLEDLPLAAQIALFAGARLVVGAHGAGLTNIVFSRPRTCVLELMPDTIIRLNFAALAKAYGLDYAIEHYHVSSGGERNIDIVWEADIDDVARKVEEMRAGFVC